MSNTRKNSDVVRARTTTSKSAAWTGAFLMLLTLVLFSLGCAKEDSVSLKNQGVTTTLSDRDKVMSGYEQTNLVSDAAEYNPNILDPNLVNAWGVAIGPTGAFWISAAETELSVIYNEEGETLQPPVTMEGDPTGQVYNSFGGFVIPGVGAAKFIFATEYGTITAWSTGDVATTMVDRSATGASYTGLELVNDGTGIFLYAVNHASGQVDVL